MLSFFLELLKLTIPGLLVFLAAYFVLKTYMENQQKLSSLKIRESQLKTTLPLKLQAYERLSLFCERIAIPNLLLRIRAEEMSVAEFRIALMLAIQQEYEHNITQQVYVSQQLWEIIKMTRNESVEMVTMVAERLDAKNSGRELAAGLMHLLSQRESTAVETALVAIKREAATNF
ncbi:MAG: hypothetical protein MI974_02285 [Chitinophagales bacterium]|nr:hypothetical protein [Chitinophagales bacterium]